MTVIEIKQGSDIAAERPAAKVKAREMGFGLVDQTRIPAMVSALDLNIFAYVGRGEVRIAADCSTHRGLKTSFTDHGPGMGDVDLALTDGFSTADSMGRDTTVIIEKRLRN